VCIPALAEKYTEFIIDFGLIGKDYDQVVVIELNEFMDTTDGCMFNWKVDRKILENGPFCFRLVEEPIPEEKQRKFLSPEWLELVQD